MLLVGRALLTSPRVVLIDEITEGLQPAVIARVQQMVAEERRSRGIAFVVVEQNVGFALAIADRYAVLKLGTVVETGGGRGRAGAHRAAPRHLEARGAGERRRGGKRRSPLQKGGRICERAEEVS